MGPPSGLFTELSRWRDKAVKRGNPTHFNSDIIPAWLNDELVAAQEVVGPDAAFSFLKQVPLSVRMKAEREIKRKIQAILGKYEGRAARSIKRGEQFDYAGMADELRVAVLPELSSLMVDNTLRLSVDTGISFDPAIINTEALRWAREYSYDLVSGLTNTTRNQIREAASAFIQTPGMTMGDIQKLIQPAFGPVRADMIASTEVTRAYSMATNEMQALLRAETPDLTTTRVWNTMEDERVCFPAWTMVDTEAGPRAIQDINPGEMARTRAGYRRVMTTNERKYSGRMIRIETEDRVVEATASHLFWTAEQEWTQASELKPGHTLQLVNGIAVVIQQVVDMYSVGLSVYNLQVEVPEYFANGILVHNCPICGPLEGAPEEEWRTEFPNGPPAHVSCRCSSSIRFESQEQLEAEFGERQAERERWMRAEGLWTEIAAETAPQWAEAHPDLYRILGDSLVVTDADTNVVQWHLSDLERIREPILRELKREGCTFHIGDTALPGLNGNKHLAGVQPRGWSTGTTWDQIPGAYNPNYKSVSAGAGRHGSASMMVHETGHAMGDLFALDDSVDLIEHHKRLYSKLDPYEQQEGPGSHAGRQEMFAEGLAETLMSEERARQKYDDQFVDYLQGILRSFF